MTHPFDEIAVEAAARAEFLHDWPDEKWEEQPFKRKAAYFNPIERALSAAFKSTREREMTWTAPYEKYSSAPTGYIAIQIRHKD